MLIREAGAADDPGIRRVHALAFQQRGEDAEPLEVALVDELRRSAAWLPRLSLVAIDRDLVVGHVVCTRAAVGTDAWPVLGLGPIGVDPACQRRGFGTALMHAVLGAAEALQEPLVALLGEPEFYRRFGFEPASRHGIDAPDDGWGEFFQVRRLSSYTSDLTGSFTYAPPFGV